MMNNPNNIYLDYAATSPIRPEVIEAMMEHYSPSYSNPSSLHRSGRSAHLALDQARAKIAEGIHATSPNEIIFTGSGSEADNLALTGIAHYYQEKGKHIITSVIEHHAVLHTCKFLETQNFEVSYLAVDQDGMIQSKDLEKALRSDTILVSIMHANNEIGTIQPIQELAKIAHENGTLFHTDAVQTGGQLTIDVDHLDVDLLTLSAHKFYGPKGVGALYVKDGIMLAPLIHGGGQESSRRAGTENLPGIVGMALAFDLATKSINTESARLTAIRDELWLQLCTKVPGIKLNGHPNERLPNNLNISFRDVEAEGLLLRLNMEGIEASMGSACNSESIEPSHVIQALGLSPKWARGTIRLSLGRHTTIDDIAYVVDALERIVSEIR